MEISLKIIYAIRNGGVANQGSGVPGPGMGISPYPLENTWVNKDENAKSLLADLEARLIDMESLGALVAAAHLDAAIVSVCREFNLPRKASDTD